jgi:hypothetical protein
MPSYATHRATRVVAPAGPAHGLSYADQTPWQLRALRVQNRRNHANAAGFPEFQTTLDATMAEIDAALERHLILSLQAPARRADVTAEIIAGYRAKRIGVVFEKMGEKV